MTDSLTHDLETLADLDNYHSWILEEIRPYLGTRLVEVGAGIGTVTNLLIRDYLTRTPGTRLEAFEPAPALYKQLCAEIDRRQPDLMQSGRITLTEGYFQASPDKCDSIILINVLEHIEDDRAMVRMAHQALTPGGVLIIYSPALQWLYSAHDKMVGHYRRYKKGDLETLVRAQGFDTVESKYMDVMGVVPWYFVNVLGGATSINPRLARLYDRWFVPVTRSVEGVWTPPVGKNILLVARKTAA